MTEGVTLKKMPTLKATHEAIKPYATLLEAGIDGTPFGPADAPLVLGEPVGGALPSSGSSPPRFYLMQLAHKPLLASHLTRHRRVTQCLAALNGKSWFILLAPPGSNADPYAKPDMTQLAAFEVSGSQAIALKQGTWHAGPYFLDETVDFVNLELSDTNITDHQTVNLGVEFGLQIELLTSQTT